MIISYQGPFYGPSGYAKMNRQLVLAMADHGANISIKPTDEPKNAVGHIPHEIIDRLRLMSGTLANRKADTLIFGHIPGLPMEGRVDKRILYTMLEVKSIRPEFFRHFNTMNQVWTPSQWCVDLFEPHTKKPVNKLPVSIANHYFKEDSHRYFDGRTDAFNLLFNGSWTKRKGIESLIQAVTLLNGNVHLWILSRPQKKFGAQAVKEIQGDISRMGGNPDFFTVIPDVVREIDMPSLYRSADAVILPSLGEGWAMPMSEAAACGVPVISTDYSGQTEFLSKNNSWLIETEEMITCEAAGMHRASAFFDPKGLVPKINPETIAKAIYDCAQNPEIANQRAKRLLEKVQEYKPEIVAKKAIILLEK